MDAALEVIKRPTEAVVYSTIFVRVMDSSYPSQDGGRERGKGYAVGYRGTSMVDVVR